MAAYEVLIEGVTEDARVFRDTLYLVGEACEDRAVEAEVRRVAEQAGLSLSTLAGAEDRVWSDSTLTPAHLARDEFLAQAGPVLPSVHQTFARAHTVFIELD